MSDSEEQKKEKTVFDYKKEREKQDYQKRLSDFIQKRKRKPAATMRELRTKRAKELGLKPSHIGIKDKE